MGDSKRYKNQQQRHSDFFQTHPSALHPLMPYLNPDWRVMEPACGKGKLVGALRLHGFDVFATDIHAGRDFLTTGIPDSIDCIITNPPYSIKDQWIERCYELGRPFALLMPYTALEGKRRQALFREHGIDLLFLPKRVDFTTPSGKKGGAWFPVAWFCWKILPERIIFSE